MRSGNAASPASSTSAGSAQGAPQPDGNPRTRAPCGREAARIGSACTAFGRLDLDLFCNQRLKRLVAFCLVILNGRAAEARDLFRSTRRG